MGGGASAPTCAGGVSHGRELATATAHDSRHLLARPRPSICVIRLIHSTDISHGRPPRFTRASRRCFRTTDEPLQDRGSTPRAFRTHHHPAGRLVRSQTTNLRTSFDGSRAHCLRWSVVTGRRRLCADSSCRTLRSSWKVSSGRSGFGRLRRTMWAARGWSEWGGASAMPWLSCVQLTTPGAR